MMCLTLHRNHHKKMVSWTTGMRLGSSVILSWRHSESRRSFVRTHMVCMTLRCMAPCSSKRCMIPRLIGTSVVLNSDMTKGKAVMIRVRVRKKEVHRTKV